MTEKKKIETSLSDTNIGYEGNVTLTFMKGKKVIERKVCKNNGTNNLFLGIAKYLVSDSDQSLKPKFLGIGSDNLPTPYTNDQNALKDEYTGKRVRLTGLKINSNVNLTTNSIDGYKAVFTGLITYSSIGSAEIKELGLFSTFNTNTLLARIRLTDQTIILTPGTDLIVDWSVLIQNQKGVN